MILKASQRANARELANHLLNGDTNEHVTIHEVRGFMSEDLHEAFDEAYAVSRGTRCKQFLFSLSLNSPDFANVPIEIFERTLERIERSLGLSGQPRAIVFHEKNGRRHCHCVWSRIKSEYMKAINLPYFKYKLSEISKQLYLEHKWPLPDGFKDKTKTLETNYNHDEWQQAARLKNNPEKLKSFFKNCWEQSDNKKSFASALQEYGFYLAKGDKRGFVVVDYEGEIYSLSRWTGIRKKELSSKLGKHEDLPSVEDAQSFLQDRISKKLTQYLHEKRAMAKEQRAPLLQELHSLTQHQRKERRNLLEKQHTRWQVEQRQRSSKIAHGLKGVWQIMTGAYAKQRIQNEQDAKAAYQRNLNEQQKLIERHLAESKELHAQIDFYKYQQQREEAHLKQQIAGYINTATEPPPPQLTEPITDKLKALETQIMAMTTDIHSLQAALANDAMSDDLRAKIKLMIERAKEAFIRQKAEQLLIKQKQAEETERELKREKEKLYKLIATYEALKQQEQQQSINRAFYKTVMHMTYSLNGLPPHEIKVAPPRKPFNEQRYTQEVKRKSNKDLDEHIKTKPKKRNDFDSQELRKSVLNVKDALRRSNSSKGPQTQNKTPHSKFTIDHPVTVSVPGKAYGSP